MSSDPTQEFLPQYAAHAVVDLEKQAKMLRASPAFTHDAALRRAWVLHTSVANFIRNAVHVVLPTNAEIYRSNALGGAMPTPDECESICGLPAPVTCFEYPWSYPSDIGRHNEHTQKASRRITLAIDLKQLGGAAKFGPADISARILSVYHHEGEGLWTIYPSLLGITQPLEPAPVTREGRRFWHVAGSVRDLQQDTCSGQMYDQHFGDLLGEMLSDIGAVVQACHALRAGAQLAERTEPSRARRKKFEKRGVEGFTYHILKTLSHAREHSREGLGTHVSPRFHVRRAHIRKLSSGALAFVRQCFVGEKKTGVVHKHYAVG